MFPEKSDFYVSQQDMFGFQELVYLELQKKLFYFALMCLQCVNLSLFENRVEMICSPEQTMHFTSRYGGGENKLVFTIERM